MNPLFLHLAEDAPEATTTAVDAIKGVAETVSAQGTEAIVQVLPALGGLVALGVVVTIGIKWIRKLGR